MTAEHGAWAAFDYRTATSDQILARARQMERKTLGELSVDVPAPVVSSARTRGDVGAVVEAWFGIPPNSRQAADFPGADVELKTVPLAGSGNNQTVKERTVLTMVDYDHLPSETWRTAAVRHKLDRILLVYVGWTPDTDIATFPVVLAELWRPDERQLAFMELDWLNVQQKVIRGEAHLISEGDGLILGAATKAADSSKVRHQPFSDIPAKPRAWSLKQSFTRSLYLEIKTRVELETLMDTLAVRRAEQFEEAIKQHYRPVRRANRGGRGHDTGRATRGQAVRGIRHPSRAGSAQSGQGRP